MVCGFSIVPVISPVFSTLPVRAWMPEIEEATLCRRILLRRRSYHADDVIATGQSNGTSSSM